MQKYVDLVRFHHAEPMNACLDTLREAGIPYRHSNDSLTTNLSIIEPGAVSAGIVMVPADQEIPARMAILNAARWEVETDGLDPDYPLVATSEQDLRNIVANPWDNGAYDIAVAEKLLRDAGVAPPPAEYVRVTSPAEAGAGPPPLPGTRRGKMSLYAYGFAAPFAGGLIAYAISKNYDEAYLGIVGYLAAMIIPGACSWVVGIIIAWNFTNATETKPDGSRHYVFDEATRSNGRHLLVYTWILFLGFFLAVVASKLLSDP